MTVAALPATVSYLEDGVALAFPVPYRFRAAIDLVVERLVGGEATLLRYGVDYSVEGGETDAGSVVTRTEATAGARLRISRHTVRAQPMVYTPDDRFPAKSHEEALDRGILIAQELDDVLGDLLLRAITVPFGEAGGTLPPAAERAGRAIVGTPGGGFGVALLGDGNDPTLRPDLAAPDGADRVGFLQAGDGSAPQSVRDKLRSGTVNLMDKISRSEWAAIEAGTSRFDATAALLNAAALKKRIMLPVGTVLANLPAMTSGLTLEGEDPEHSVLAARNTDMRLLTADSGSAARLLKDIHIAAVTLLGMPVPTFAEHAHLLALNGVDSALIERVRFTGFRGDGLYLGSGHVRGQERHNKAITLRKCVFEGVNYANRNAVSVIDCDGLLIEDCEFYRTSAPTMPGAIDFEPDNSDVHTIRDAIVRGNRFEAIGGNVGAIGVFIPELVRGFAGLTIDNNSFDDYQGSGADIAIRNNRITTESDSSWAITITRNRGYNGRSPYNIYGVKGVVLDETNVWDTYSLNTVEGWNGPKDVLRQAILRPRLRNLLGAKARLFRNIRDAEIGGTLEYCGDDAADAYPLQFSGGASDKITIRDLRVKKRNRQITAINVDTHSFTPSTNRAIDNDLDGMASQFPATAPGQALFGTVAWDPGALANGAGETSVEIPVGGAAFGDTVRVGAPYDLRGLTATGYVTAADLVRIRLQNHTGGTVDLAAGTWKVSVIKALN